MELNEQIEIEEIEILREEINDERNKLLIEIDKNYNKEKMKGSEETPMNLKINNAVEVLLKGSTVIAIAKYFDLKTNELKKILEDSLELPVNKKISAQILQDNIIDLKSRDNETGRELTSSEHKGIQAKDSRDKLKQHEKEKEMEMEGVNGPSFSGVGM
jgi:hypothetical protein